MADAVTTHKERLVFLVDRQMCDNEVEYHAQVKVFRRWLRMTELALRDEGVDDAVAGRVLNRVVFGVPDRVDACLRVEDRRQMLEEMKHAPPMDAAKLIKRFQDQAGPVTAPPSVPGGPS